MGSFYAVKESELDGGKGAMGPVVDVIKLFWRKSRLKWLFVAVWA